MIATGVTLTITSGIAVVFVHTRDAALLQSAKVRAQNDMDILANEIGKFYVNNHRTDESLTPFGPTIPSSPCYRPFFNFLRTTSDFMPSQSHCKQIFSQNWAVGISPLGIAKPELNFDLAYRRSRKIVLESRSDPGPVIKRIEYETVCSPTTTNPNYLANPFMWYQVMNEIQHRGGCMLCPPNETMHRRGMAVMKRVWNNWDDTWDFRGNNSSIGNSDEATCFPKDFYAYDAAARTCQIKSNLPPSSQTPVGMMLCAWTGDLNGGSDLKLRLWSFYPAMRDTIRANQIIILDPETEASVTISIPNSRALVIEKKDFKFNR